MRIVGKTLDFPRKVMGILHNVPVLRVDGPTYSRFLAKASERNEAVEKQLIGMGLRKGWINPETIRSLPQYDDVFTKTTGALTPECSDNITHSVYSLGSAPDDVTILNYLGTRDAWRPALMNVFGIQGRKTPIVNPLSADPGHLDMYSEKFLVEVGIRKPSPIFLGGKARIMEQTIEAMRNGIKFFKEKGEDTSEQERMLENAEAELKHLLSGIGKSVARST